MLALAVLLSVGINVGTCFNWAICSVQRFTATGCAIARRFSRLVIGVCRGESFFLEFPLAIPFANERRVNEELILNKIRT